MGWFCRQNASSPTVHWHQQQQQQQRRRRPVIDTMPANDSEHLASTSSLYQFVRLARPTRRRSSASRGYQELLCTAPACQHLPARRPAGVKRRHQLLQDG